MYGLLTHVGCGLSQPLRDKWMAHLCGVCLSLKQQAGQLARLAANGEAALLSALVAAQSVDPAKRDESLCLLRQPRHQQVIDKDAPGARFGAGMALLMASSKLHDHLQDDELRPRVLRQPATSLAQRWGEVARQILTPMEFDAPFIERQIQNQSDLEKHAGYDFEYYARPTELSAGMTFAHTAILAGQPQNTQVLFDIGRTYGRILYLVDNFKDQVNDATRGCFNALSAVFPQKDMHSQAADIFTHAKVELNSLVGQLSLPRPHLVHMVLVHRLGQIGYHALGLCQTGMADCRTSNHAALSIEPGPGNYFPAPGEDQGDKQQGVSRSCCNCCGRNDSGMCCYYCPDCFVNSPNCGDCSQCSDCSFCQHCDCSHLVQSCDCGQLCQNCDCGHLCQGCDCSNCCECGNCDCGNCDCGGCDCGSC